MTHCAMAKLGTVSLNTTVRSARLLNTGLAEEGKEEMINKQS